jgi:hypothetical protein
MAASLTLPVRDYPSPRLTEMTVERRRLAYESGELTMPELFAWAALFPDEVPLVDGEYPWIVATLADLE